MNEVKRTIFRAEQSRAEQSRAEQSRAEQVGIRQATEKGYIECDIGGVADFSYPTSKLRRGRVQGHGQISPTITAGNNMICRIEKVPKLVGGLGDMKSNNGTQFYQQDRIYDARGGVHSIGTPRTNTRREL